MQPQGHTQFLINLIDFKMNLQEAGDAPRIRHGESSQPTGEKMTDGGTVYLESGFPPETVEKLKQMGHTIKKTRGGYGGYQAVMKDHKNKVYFRSIRIKKRRPSRWILKNNTKRTTNQTEFHYDVRLCKT